MIAVLENVFPLAIGGVVAVLDGRHRKESPCAVDLRRRHLREADVADFSFMPELLNRLELLFLRNVRIDSMKLPQVDPLQTQTAQAAFDFFAQSLRASVRVPASGTGAIQSAFCRY